MKDLIISTLKTFLFGVLIFGACLFLPAWTLAYWQAWVFILIFIGAANALGVYLALNDPALLERRKKVGPAAEQNLVQKIVISLAIASGFGLFIFCALDHRFGWSPVPALVSWLGEGLIVLGFLVTLLVFKENTYGASTVQVAEDQKVISTGPYARVRHPMYVGVLIMMCGIPLALDSWWGLVILLLFLPLLAVRILDEEKLLKKDLPGYQAYTQKVCYRLVPYLW